MRFNALFFFVVLGVISLFFSGCQKDTTTNNSQTIDADEINTFIYTSMYNYYLWRDNSFYLNRDVYDTNKDSLENFLNRYTDHTAFFNDLVYSKGNIDKWSVITSNYIAFENELEGHGVSMGFSYTLAQYGSGTNILGCIDYVVKGGPADLAGIKRGDIFTAVNDEQLTTSNYKALLNEDSYKLSFAEISGTTYALNGKTASLAAVELTEDPIYLDTIYTINSQKIAYLVYNHFSSGYDKELNNIIFNFKSAGISNLILDLRYNQGGSLESVINLASMLYGTFTNKVFLKAKYNSILQNYYDRYYGTSYSEINFQSYITNSDNSQTSINSLGLSGIYIITSGNTSSAAENLINGLKPYMDVTTVGTNTYGDYVSCALIHDYVSADTINPAHNWALYPVICKVTNVGDVSDFSTGLAPTKELAENITNFSVLGSLSEPLLKKTVETITGFSLKKSLSSSNVHFSLMENATDPFHRRGTFMKNFQLPLKAINGF